MYEESHYLLIKDEKGNNIKHLLLILLEKNNSHTFGLTGQSLLDS